MTKAPAMTPVLMHPRDRGVHRDVPIDLPAASASTSNAVSIRSRVPSLQNRACRLQTVCHGPKCGGRSRHEIPTRKQNKAPFDHRPMRRHRPAHRPLQRRQLRLDPRPHLIGQHLKAAQPRRTAPQARSTWKTRPRWSLRRRRQARAGQARRRLWCGRERAYLTSRDAFSWNPARNLSRLTSGG